MSSPGIIVFGPTGNIGSVAAIASEEKGATVFLAMRDPSKTITGLTSEREHAGRFERIRADLSDAPSVRHAAQKSGAKRALIYCMFGSQDNMLSTFEALKSGGIEYVVFISSFSVQGNLSSIPATESIPYIHAQAELNLEKVFGDSYVAVRPGSFATNTLNWVKRIANTGEVKLYRPEVHLHCIAPIDMGRVAAGLLVHGPKQSEKVVYLVGPDQISQEEAVHTIGSVLGRDIKVKPVEAEEGVRVVMEDMNVPESIASCVITFSETMFDKHTEFDQTWVDNIELYGGKPPTSFKAWVEENKALFTPT